MYKWLIGIAIVLLSAGLLIALPYQPKTTLTWEPPTTNIDGSPLTDLAGFKVYYSQASGVYTDTQSKDVGNVVTVNIVQTMAITPKGNYCFVVTAYDVAGNESDYSNEVCATFSKKASPPKTLGIQ